MHEFKSAGHDVHLEFMEESLIALQGKSDDHTWCMHCAHYGSLTYFCHNTIHIQHT